MSAQPARSPLHLVDERPPGPGLTDFALWLRANGCSERTIESRLHHVKDFTRHHPSFPNVRPMHVTAWLGREALAPWSRATFYGHLRSYFTFAMENDVIDVDPMARMRRPHVAHGKPRPLTPAQVDLLLTASRGRRNANVGAWLTLSLYAGLRAHEIAKIRGEDVTEDTIYVHGKGGVDAQIPTHPVIWALALDRPRQGWWFPSSASSLGHVRSTSVSTMTTKLFKANGIEGSLHRMRHTFATTLLRTGANIRVVQELMRHKSLSSTAVYTGVDEEELRNGIAGLQARVTAAKVDYFRTDASAANYTARKAREAARADALRNSLATRHPTATATEDGREDMARYLAQLAKEARDAAGEED
jgi:integrase/recombinase XerD